MERTRAARTAASADRGRDPERAHLVPRAPRAAGSDRDVEGDPLGVWPSTRARNDEIAATASSSAQLRALLRAGAPLDPLRVQPTTPVHHVRVEPGHDAHDSRRVPRRAGGEQLIGFGDRGHRQAFATIAVQRVERRAPAPAARPDGRGLRDLYLLAPQRLRRAVAGSSPSPPLRSPVGPYGHFSGHKRDGGADVR